MASGVLYHVWVCDTDPNDPDEWRSIDEVYVPSLDASFNFTGNKLNVLGNVNAATRYGASGNLPDDVIAPPHDALALRSVPLTDEQIAVLRVLLYSADSTTDEDMEKAWQSLAAAF